ncbi:hypothetical protein IC744_16300 [Microbacterium hominis]|uniref:hypothetical protein n=1 Tax=Microbacterium hominis TaxID=162426 RepID=UPI00168A4B68|nr:hypothetical protein [Microbacterium hominis]QOC24823.1 hypothetical protein IC745_10550 [Microbacterium hominis]QOC28876.1 hypothetical protein IC744_16300 [Microbacterium hominis]
MADLRVIRDESPALSREELQKRGNELATQVKQAAINAVRESMHSVYLERGVTLTPARLREWRHRARTARDAWQRVDDIASELLREVEKTTRKPEGRGSDDA